MDFYDQYEDEDERLAVLARIEEAQGLISDGHAWIMEGAVGRHAMGMIEDGLAVVGSKVHYDYWGNLVPSRDMLEAGTKGTFEFVAERQGEAFANTLREIVEEVEAF
jgi:hypothetical protein